MKVKRLIINSFRGIDNLTLEFNHDEPIVIIGNNGVGKSSILDCIAILLSRLLYLIQIPNISAELEQKFSENPDDIVLRSFSEQDIKNGYKKTANAITIELLELYGLQRFTWFVTKENGINQNVEGMTKLRAVAKDIHDRFESSAEANIPLAVYYPTIRAVLETPLEIHEEYLFEQIDAYEEALDGILIGFERFFEWFRALEDVENEEIRDNSNYRNRKLEAVRQSIYSLIPDFLNLRIRRSPLRMTVKKQGQELIVNQLSDGEKCLLAMVGDLARRLAIANPGLEKPLEGSAVVLIDEIELHLHPKWQREIIPALTRTFPNCQFIITTHSPQVISQIKPDGIYILEATPEGIVAKQPESSFGRDSNRILEDVMGVPARPQEIKDNLRQLFRLIDAGNLDAAKELRQQIEEEIGGDESEFVRADILMRRKEILNR